MLPQLRTSSPSAFHHDASFGPAPLFFDPAVIVAPQTLDVPTPLHFGTGANPIAYGVGDPTRCPSGVFRSEAKAKTRPLIPAQTELNADNVEQTVTRLSGYFLAHAKRGSLKKAIALLLARNETNPHAATLVNKALAKAFVNAKADAEAQAALQRVRFPNRGVSVMRGMQVAALETEEILRFAAKGYTLSPLSVVSRAELEALAKAGWIEIQEMGEIESTTKKIRAMTAEMQQLEAEIAALEKSHTVAEQEEKTQAHAIRKTARKLSSLASTLGEFWYSMWSVFNDQWVPKTRKKLLMARKSTAEQQREQADRLVSQYSLELESKRGQLKSLRTLVNGLLVAIEGFRTLGPSYLRVTAAGEQRVPEFGPRGTGISSIYGRIRGEINASTATSAGTDSAASVMTNLYFNQRMTEEKIPELAEAYGEIRSGINSHTATSAGTDGAAAALTSLYFNQRMTEEKIPELAEAYGEIRSGINSHTATSAGTDGAAAALTSLYFGRQMTKDQIAKLAEIYAQIRSGINSHTATSAGTDRAAAKMLVLLLMASSRNTHLPRISQMDEGAEVGHHIEDQTMADDDSATTAFLVSYLTDDSLLGMMVGGFSPDAMIAATLGDMANHADDIPAAHFGSEVDTVSGMSFASDSDEHEQDHAPEQDVVAVAEDTPMEAENDLVTAMDTTDEFVAGAEEVIDVADGVDAEVDMDLNADFESDVDADLETDVDVDVDVDVDLGSD